jgi:hypothetical protein
MAKDATTETATPTFAGVAIDAIPAAVKGASPANIATGRAILDLLDAGQGAVESTVHETRTAAVARGSALKRYVAAADKDRAVSSRVFAVTGGYQVAITPKVDKPAKGK